MNITTRVLAVAASTSLVLLGAACSSDDSDSSSTAGAADTMTSESNSGSGATTSSAMADPAANLVGPGCAEYAKTVPEGAGSVNGMAQDPVATAASNNPLLTTLTAAVSGQLNPQVNLVDTLNSGQFTVFAPVDAAFAKVDPATIETLKTDSALLTKVLTYHVVPGQIAPDDIDGEHATVEGGSVTVTGSGDDLKVNDAGVICGGVQTANATVYLIDSVLMPQ
ncbi:MULTISPECIES: fasciclin domain-containing protein [Rhodococcus]|uniref:Fasciclin domain-containing protein n=1 Tax=Rhodococcus oxybenzonivorans TaxID=1990687 RepID=A0AAE4V2W7_9NOCA|nr:MULTISPECIES: fasciclin domain-containing protein [Rhodococcus]MDV7241479.1 fasciclin domain-containing protein [Rhodococcus oxybenzonivorans]MDV7267613.1 fasciclin domain-containing protein [Rhodococcus oxybenzonivorans]MDV7273988.1 fasciclin domain-containing protein [Rhodococcus oxybenzonivorans]MDV7333760.1 fasciclin domain-containing protein [Rhodococcus oxybenzonivorans]MDV7343179.1 fasciclin domain-containing protein [Rhodococcus oxybenzonivorans]